MSKLKNKTSPQTIADAESAAKATQRPGQSKKETKLIAQGIQKGIEHYKKQHKAKARELDKRLRKVKAPAIAEDPHQKETTAIVAPRSYLPWVLLAVSWVGFAFYYVAFN